MITCGVKILMFPILISIPHSSCFIPKEIRDRMALTDKKIKSYCDLFTNEIFDVKNTYIVKSYISRLVADVNRAPDDIETEAELAREGVVIHITDDGTKIYKDEPTPEMIEERIKKYHNTYHEKIEKLWKKIKFLIDGHSMRSIGPTAKPDAGKKRKDIILGNRDYTTCSRSQTLFFKKYFEDRGYSVAINNPYRGKYVLGYHCNRKMLPGIQIEINRKLYMSENTLKPYKGKIKKLKSELTDLVRILADKL